MLALNSTKFIDLIVIYIHICGHRFSSTSRTSRLCMPFILLRKLNSLDLLDICCSQWKPKWATAEYEYVEQHFQICKGICFTINTVDYNHLVFRRTIIMLITKNVFQQLLSFGVLLIQHYCVFATNLLFHDCIVFLMKSQKETYP